MYKSENWGHFYKKNVKPDLKRRLLRFSGRSDAVRIEKLPSASSGKETWVFAIGEVNTGEFSYTYMTREDLVNLAKVIVEEL